MFKIKKGAILIKIAFIIHIPIFCILPYFLCGKKCGKFILKGWANTITAQPESQNGFCILKI